MARHVVWGFVTRHTYINPEAQYNIVCQYNDSNANVHAYDNDGATCSDVYV